MRFDSVTRSRFEWKMPDDRDDLAFKVALGSDTAVGVRDEFAPSEAQQRASQDDLAYEAEISRSYLSQLEKDSFYASLKIIGKLSEVLEVEPAELLKLPKRRSKESPMIPGDVVTGQRGENLPRAGARAGDRLSSARLATCVGTCSPVSCF